MLDIKLLKNSWFFKEVVLNKWEVLFEEWDKDANIYILLVWNLSVSKYTSNNKKDEKILAYLTPKDVFWEWALNSSDNKQVTIRAKQKSYLISIDAIKWLDDFSKQYPQEGLNLLKYIIYLSNKRISDANYLIASSYKISKEIISLNDISNKSIITLIEELKNILKVNEVIYYESNPVMDNYITLRYNTNNPWKLLNKTIELTDSKLELLKLNISNFYSYNQKLSIWSNNLGYLVFIKKSEKFSENDKKVIATTSTSIAWVIKQKQLIDEQRDKDYMEY